MKKIRWIYILPAVAGAALMSVASCKDADGTNDASGTFEATEVMVSSEASGRIVSLEVNEGGVISAGAVCGMVDTVQLSLQKRQLEAGVKAALSRIRDAETQTAYIREQIGINRREAERVRRLIEADAANTKQLDDINASISLLETQLSATEADIAQNNTIAEAEAASYRAQIAQVEESLRRCRIVSPIDGTVLLKYAEAGELTAAGKPLFKVADLTDMNLRAYITASQLTRIKLGQKVRVFADSGEKGVREYEGTVSWISDQAEFTPKTIQTRDERANLVYAIKVSFVNDGYVKIGMYGDVRF
ncbi:MAG TPA: HlyD family efflux transporter periplasmic adaptor subunit [Candidatus Coprenecus pullistercoris]|nr:HlyD family efflux transporter periplasmic adaptor subunit [Candidatus Coprenecus pullistercoris]